MGKRVTVTTRREDDEEDDFKRETKSVEVDPAELSYAEFISRNKGAQGCRVKVHRQTPRGRQYCFFGTPEEISEEYVRIYHAKQPYANEEGTYFLSVEVNGELRNVFPVEIAPQVGTPGTEIHSGNGGMAEVLRLIQAQNERIERLLSNDKAPLSEMLDNMIKLDTLRGGPKELPLEAIMKAVEIGKSLNPSDANDWNSLLVSTLKENGPMLLGIVKSALSKPAPAPGAIEPPKPEHVPERISEDMPASEQETMMLKQAIAFLKKKALRQSDPGLYIDLIVDNREDPLYAKLISEIASKEFSEFAAIDTEIEQPQYVDFFRVIYDGIRSVFVPKSAVAATPGGKSGNKKNTGSNGATGKSVS